ncbi:hypothetical protein G7046_g9348 [Stylonectria norvegica]|nr:hypothetical protein G7046_g9348 [Stylonectria norvegica]
MGKSDRAGCSATKTGAVRTLDSVRTPSSETLAPALGGELTQRAGLLDHWAAGPLLDSAEEREGGRLDETGKTGRRRPTLALSPTSNGGGLEILVQVVFEPEAATMMMAAAAGVVSAAPEAEGRA